MLHGHHLAILLECIRDAISGVNMLIDTREGGDVFSVHPDEYLGVRQRTGSYWKCGEFRRRGDNNYLAICIDGPEKSTKSSPDFS